MSQAVGHKYGISANKLTRAQTVKVADMGLDENGEKRLIAADRTFFCSELVAKAFKILGILEDDDTSSAKFYPSHFSTKYDSFLKLTEGTSIESELLVIMDRDDLVNVDEKTALKDD